ncbi:MAG: phenylacetate--CoA ligase family protein [Candidatus Methanomethylophilaceae archaeon]|nr:phenylacetate--CoA ligase family protein [Candidatus Methanomethylophilaceae archaeon]
MGAWDSMKMFIIRRRLLANMIPEGCEHPLEEWMSIKARMTFKKNKELRERIGKRVLDEVTRGDFNEYQLFRFREQMRYVQKESPYYRNKFKELDVTPDDIRTWDDLERIPLTEPLDLAENSMYFFAASRTKMATEFTTTGTTGHRKFIGYTVNDLVSKIDIVASALKEVGMEPGDSLHVMFPLVSAWDPSLIMVGACKILGYGSSVCSENDIDKQYSTIKESGSTYIIGLPSFIYRVTVLMGDRIDLRSLGIKRIISTSEPLSESMRHTMEDAWGCKVIDVWGMTEFGLACAVECEEQNGLHTDEANLLFEVIDPETMRHVPDGTEGELVITSLNAEGTPLIRYRTHDIAAMLPPPCDCGARFNRRLRKPSGRMDLQFKIGMGHKIYPLLFDDAVFADKRIVDYQVKISKDGFRDLLTFEVETDSPSDELKGKIIDSVCRIMEVEQGLEEDLVSRPVVEFVPTGSMEYAVKAKKIIDLRENYDKKE